MVDAVVPSGEDLPPEPPKGEPPPNVGRRILEKMRAAAFVDAALTLDEDLPPPRLPGQVPPVRERRSRLRWRAAPSRPRRAIGAATLVVTVTGGVVWLQAGSNRSAQALTETIQLVGTVQPIDQTALDFGATGQVISVNVKEGQVVSPGTVLATLDPTPLTAQLSRPRPHWAQRRRNSPRRDAGNCGHSRH